MLGRVKKPNRPLNPDALKSTYNPLLDDLRDELDASVRALAEEGVSRPTGSNVGMGNEGVGEFIDDIGSAFSTTKEGNENFNSLAYNHVWSMDFDAKPKTDNKLFQLSVSDGGAGTIAVEALQQAVQHFQLAMRRHNMGAFFSAKDSAAKTAKAREVLKRMNAAEMQTLILELVDILEDVHVEREKIAKLCGGDYDDACKEGQLSSSMLSTMSIASMARSPVHETHQVAMTRNNEGNVMINRYTVLANLGQGAFGQVKLAEEADTGRKVAIKIISKKLLKRRINCSAAESENALNREIAIMKKVRHQNCVSLYEVIDDPDSNKLYLIMDYIANGPVVRVQNQTLPPIFLRDVEEQKKIDNVLYNRYLLRCALRHNAESGNISLSLTEMDQPATLFLCRPIDQVVCAYYLRQLVSGLRYMHKRNVVHHDIKPDNILLGYDHRVFLTDFGVSEIMETAVDAAGAGGEEDEENSSNGNGRDGEDGGDEEEDEEAENEEGGGGGPAAVSRTRNGRMRRAKSSAARPMTQPRKTGARLGAGTLLFTAPELLDVALRPEEIDPFATDVWALGVTLYCMLVGCAPFHGSYYGDITNNIKTQSIPWNGMNMHSQPLLPHWLEVLQGLLEKNPAKRWLLVDLKKYLDADDFQRELERVEQQQASLNGSASPPSMSEGTIRAPQHQQTQQQQQQQQQQTLWKGRELPGATSVLAGSPDMGLIHLHRPSLTISEISSSSAGAFSVSGSVRTFSSVELSGEVGYARFAAAASSLTSATGGGGIGGGGGVAPASGLRRAPGRTPVEPPTVLAQSQSNASLVSGASAAAVAGSLARRRRLSLSGREATRTLVPTEKELREARRMQTGQFLVRRDTVLSAGAQRIVQAFVQRIRRRLASRHAYMHASPLPPTYPVSARATEKTNASTTQTAPDRTAGQRKEVTPAGATRDASAAQNGVQGSPSLGRHGTKIHNDEVVAHLSGDWAVHSGQSDMPAANRRPLHVGTAETPSLHNAHAHAHTSAKDAKKDGPPDRDEDRVVLHSSQSFSTSALFMNSTPDDTHSSRAPTHTTANTTTPAARFGSANAKEEDKDRNRTKKRSNNNNDNNDNHNNNADVVSMTAEGGDAPTNASPAIVEAASACTTPSSSSLRSPPAPPPLHTASRPAEETSGGPLASSPHVVQANRSPPRHNELQPTTQGSFRQSARTAAANGLHDVGHRTPPRAPPPPRPPYRAPSATKPQPTPALSSFAPTNVNVATLVRDLGNTSLDAILSMVNLPSMSALSNSSNLITSDLSYDALAESSATAATSRHSSRPGSWGPPQERSAGRSAALVTPARPMSGYRATATGGNGAGGGGHVLIGANETRSGCAISDARGSSHSMPPPPRTRRSPTSTTSSAKCDAAAHDEAAEAEEQTRQLSQAHPPAVTALRGGPANSREETYVMSRAPWGETSSHSPDRHRYSPNNSSDSSNNSNSHSYSHTNMSHASSSSSIPRGSHARHGSTWEKDDMPSAARGSGAVVGQESTLTRPDGSRRRARRMSRERRVAGGTGGDGVHTSETTWTTAPVGKGAEESSDEVSRRSSFGWSGGTAGGAKSRLAAAMTPSTQSRRGSVAHPLHGAKVTTTATRRGRDLSKRTSRMAFGVNARDVWERLAPDSYSNVDETATVSQNSLSALARKRLGPSSSPTMQHHRTTETSPTEHHVPRSGDVRSRGTGHVSGGASVGGAAGSGGVKTDKTTPSSLPPAVKQPAGGNTRPRQPTFTATEADRTRSQRKT